MCKTDRPASTLERNRGENADDKREKPQNQENIGRRAGANGSATRKPSDIPRGIVQNSLKALLIAPEKTHLLADVIFGVIFVSELRRYIASVGTMVRDHI